MGLGSVGDLVSAFRLAGWYHRRAVALADKIQTSAAIGLAYVGLTHYHLCLG